METISWKTFVSLFLFPLTLLADPLIAIRAGSLLDVEKGAILKNRIILVRGERIEKVIPAGEKLPPEARKIDLSNYLVTPGLIDCHTHLMDSPQHSGAAAPLEISPARVAFLGAKNAKATCWPDLQPFET